MARVNGAILVALSALWCRPTDSWSQSSGAVEPVAIAGNLRQADSLHAAGDVAGAMAIVESLLDTNPEDVSLLLRAAREAVVYGIVSEGNEVQNRWFERGEGYAERALAIVPGDTAAVYWLIAAQGRRAVQSPALTAARLGVSIYDRATWLLGLDSLHAGANHALGVLNVEVMKLPPFGRFLARTLAPRRILRDTSWENAEFLLRRAIDASPQFPLYRLDLGKAYFFQGKFEEARSMLQSVVDLPIVDVPTDAVFRAQARKYLGWIP